MTDILSVKFLEELLRLCFLRQSVVDKISPHLKYQYLPSPEFKQIYKDLTDHYTLQGHLPTFGILHEKYKNQDKLITVLKRIQECDIVDPEPLLKQLESYIKDVRFQLLWQEVIELHKKQQNDKGRALMAQGSQEIVDFSIFRNNNNFVHVFRDFQKVQLDKQIRKEGETTHREKIPFGILPCDVISNGGMDAKDTVLWIMRSGVGKSTVLKWHGMHACELGYDVLHIQAEGSEEEAFDKYTQIWSAENYHNTKLGDFTDYDHLVQLAQKMVSLRRDICLKSIERFDELSMLNVRDIVIEYIDEHGKPPDELILDSIDLVNPGDGLHYGVDTQSIKMKLQNSSRKFKNICNEFDIRGITATQTADVKLDVWNDPGRVLTRSDSMGDKNIANSYSYVFTGNQTIDEEKDRTMRIFFDKVRYYNAQSRVYPIATNFNIGRFFDAQRTRKLFKDIYEPVEK